MLTQQEILTESFVYFCKQAPVLFFCLSKNALIRDANEYAKRITGRRLIGENFRDLVVDFTGQLNLDALIRSPQKEQLIHITSAAMVPQSYFFTFKQIADDILAFGRLDTDEIESMRKSVLKLNQELNNLTRELHKKNAQLKRLNAEKNRFLGMAAHDLRKPIGLVMSYSEFLIDEASEVLNVEHQGFLNTINSSCTFMKRLVDDFLDVSAIEAGKFDLDLQPASILNVLEQSLELNNLQAAKKAIELEIRCDENFPLTPLDASKIEQVITNLVSNAIEHTPSQTKVIITLSHDKQWIFFSVQDAGPGIPADEMEKIFKPFEKTSVKKTGGEKSTGLGMLISRKVIETHGGHIWVESPPNKGAIIRFKIPIKDVLS